MIATLLAALLQSSPALPEILASEPRWVTAPVWLRTPSAEDFARYYPEAAIREDLAGMVTLKCQVVAGGTFDLCEVVSETPAGKGFNNAALKLSRIFKMEETAATGESVVGGTVRIPLRFLLPAGPEARPVRVLAPAFAGARASVDCRLKAGAIDNCVVASATPYSAELSEAALSVAQQIKFKGTATGRAVIPIIFQGEAVKP